MNNNGLIIYEDADIVAIATGLASRSENTKTGAMIQVYILYRHESPLNAIRSGNDSAICGRCPHRAEYDSDGAIEGTRRCFVNIGHAPRAVWNCYQRGGYTYANGDYSQFAGRIVRWGTYGDPAFIPMNIVRRVSAIAAGRTGYTHQWRAYPELRPYLMASCDSIEDAIEASARGWRYFRVARKGDTVKRANEISCPASHEAGKRTTCESCRLCNGSRGRRETRKSIVIQDHSAIAGTRQLIQIQVAR